MYPLITPPSLLLAALTLVWLLSACTTTAPPNPPAITHTTPAPPPSNRRPAVQPVEAEPRALATLLEPPLPGPVGALLAYADRVRGMTPNELTIEMTRLGEPGEAPTQQMQLALALIQTRTPNDLARALALVQRVVGNTSAEARPLQPLARLLLPRYQEQRRLEDERERQTVQLRESQRRIEQLNERIEALRAIERSFSRPAAPSSSGSGAKP